MTKNHLQRVVIWLTDDEVARLDCLMEARRDKPTDVVSPTEVLTEALELLFDCEQDCMDAEALDAGWSSVDNGGFEGKPS
jgi:hypothetical protein